MEMLRSEVTGTNDNDFGSLTIIGTNLELRRIELSFLEKGVRSLQKKQPKMTIYTFDLFWAEWYRINPNRKTDKARCFNIWYQCNFQDRKKAAIQDITKTNLSAFKYLKSKL